jgi:hypothetical protein
VSAIWTRTRSPGPISKLSGAAANVVAASAATDTKLIKVMRMIFSTNPAKTFNLEFLVLYVMP